MPFMKFGKKKDKKEDDDLEEESGLLMSTKGEQSASATESEPAPASPQPSDDLDPGATDGETADAEKEEDPLLAAALADPVADEGAAEAPAETGSDDKADAADLMAAFQTDEVSNSELDDLLVGVEIIAASVLLQEAREVRSLLPPEAFAQGESAT